MSSQFIFTPSETILLNGFLFAESRNPLHAFALPLHGDLRCADEKKLAITMLTAAFFANLKNGCLSFRRIEHKSVLQDDPFMVVCRNTGQWPKDTLEHKLINNGTTKSNSEITLYQLFNNIYPRPVYDSPWRDIDWFVCNGLYQRDLLKADSIEFDAWAKPRVTSNRFRVGKYLPLEGISYPEETRQSLAEGQGLLSRARSDTPDLWSAVQARITQPKTIK